MQNRVSAVVGVYFEELSLTLGMKKPKTENRTEITENQTEKYRNRKFRFPFGS
jgi:hypothetical protein